jgi:hypothetical protein
VPSAMICDDHDIHDDWNISASWLAAMRATPGWNERGTSGLMAYLLYQHLGNLAPGASCWPRPTGGSWTHCWPATPTTCWW